MTLSETERARLSRSVNAALRSFVDRGKYGIQVVHSRRGNAGFSLIDQVGHWAGMPELLEKRIFGQGPAEEEGPPDMFATLKDAIKWAMAQGAYDKVETAREAFNTLMALENPVSARERRNFWVTYVNNIVAATEHEE